MYPYDAIPNDASIPIPGRQGPARSEVVWDHYQVSLTPQPPRQTPVSAAQSPPRPLASPGVRLVAAVFDALFACLPWLVGHFVVLAIPDQPAWKASIVGSLLLLPSLVQVTLLARRGQTIGKMAMGIRIVRYDDDSNPGLWHGWLLRNGLPRLILLVPVFGQLFMLIDLLFIFGPEHRCLHDQIADTKVVEA